MEAPGNGRATNKACTMQAFSWMTGINISSQPAGAGRVSAPWPPLQGVLALRLLRSSRRTGSKEKELPVPKGTVFSMWKLVGWWRCGYWVALGRKGE